MADTSSELKLRITEGCPTQLALNTAARAIFEHSSMRQHLDGSRFRLLSLQPLESADKAHNPVAAERYRATVYDCTNNRSLVVEGRLADTENLEISPSDAQPLPTEEEFDAAVAILQRDETIGRAICDQNVRVYRPMPPLIPVELYGRQAVRLVRDQWLRHRAAVCGLPRQAGPLSGACSDSQRRLPERWGQCGVRPDLSRLAIGGGVFPGKRRGCPARLPAVQQPGPDDPRFR